MKSKKKQRSSHIESESDSDDDDALAADDFEAPEKFKVMKIHTASMRTDAIISNSLDVSRNRLEEVFYGPGLLLNGAKMLKKSIKMEEGDYVDLVVDKVDDQLKVKRVKIIKIYSGKTNTEKLSVKVRVWKAPFLITNPDDGCRSS
ncbi:chromosome 6 open reading frame 203 [Elysia marginata]|uniref:Chromosome 6 open reading frame 203 n=1 Tax=Elysia marginata TaxID=1093978 RepID=A0AAV4EA68_9GAST|nr:chromosome 6 open reading frame 203 [Elysia marginata]